MKTFRCTCGQAIFFENNLCGHCGNTLGYAPQQRQMLSLRETSPGLWVSQAPNKNDDGYHLCKNWTDYQLCNWLVAAKDLDQYCLACRLNQVVPALTLAQNRTWWARMEASKRRLIFTLLALKLPVVSKHEDSALGLAFAFLEDQRTNPLVYEELVLTGHYQGLICVNVAEADHAVREQTKQQLGEPYRTLLGHFRHESGHYYWDRLIKNNARLTEFRTLFGDETLDYKATLERYHSSAGTNNWQSHYISAYAQSHPLEDWAETWAHYLHMVDTIETAADFGLVPCALDDFDPLLKAWIDLTIKMNALNRGMGLEDIYPFVLTTPIIAKLRWIHHVVSTEGSPSSNAI